MGFSYARVVDKTLLVICEQEGGYRKERVPYVLIKKKDGTSTWVGKRYYGSKRSPGVCFVALETVEEGDIVYMRNHEGKTRTFQVKGNRLVRAQTFQAKDDQLVAEPAPSRGNTSGPERGSAPAGTELPRENTPSRSCEPRGKASYDAPRRDRTAAPSGAPDVSGERAVQAKSQDQTPSGYIAKGQRAAPLYWVFDNEA